uniref:Chitin-binding type-4 domain-containing protein n=1 Tax=Clytia hemisphaerica TaxID=252671 RepID=A0A7M5XG29_9CNID|eukprot:TCONS_00029034-protein
MKFGSFIFCFFVFHLFPANVFGHGAMVIPYNWFDHPQWVEMEHGYEYGFVGMKSQQMCTPGADIPKHRVCPNPEHCEGLLNKHIGLACFWFTNYTFIEKPTLFDPKLRTYAHTGYEDQILHNPWRAPGFAPVATPCGAAGGNPYGCFGDKECGNDNGGYQLGPKATEFEFAHDIHVTDWTRGDHVEVAWGIRANHGGGYSYRLCKIPNEGRKALTEECFQQTPLRFVGNKQWVQFGEDRSTRFEFPAVRTDKGTFPPDSQWTKNPIPSCNGIHGGSNYLNPPCINGTQFPPPGPNLEGHGFYFREPKKHFPFSIIDLVEIPKDLEEGEYVLSFRWDCEQTSQVWNTCASVRLH